MLMFMFSELKNSNSSQSMAGIGYLAAAVVNKLKDSKEEPQTQVDASTLSRSKSEDLVESGVVVKLIQIKGRRRVKTRQVELSAKSLNQGDTFILDTGPKLFLWYGSRANRMEKAKGLDVCTRIKDKDRNTRATIMSLEEIDPNPEFWNHLGGRVPVAEESQGGDDEVTDSNDDDLVLYRVEENGGSSEAVVVENGRPAKEMLESSYVYLLDSLTEFYIWVGKSSSFPAKTAGLALAKEYLQKTADRPKWVKIVRVTEGTETVLFKEKFSNWPDKLLISTQMPSMKGRVACMYFILLGFQS
jgi:hypothetical protein